MKRHPLSPRRAVAVLATVGVLGGLGLMPSATSLAALRRSGTTAVKVDPAPSVYVDTMAPDPSHPGEYGIEVGNLFIAPKIYHEWLQVAVFDRSTLAYLPDKSGNFDCPEAAAHPHANQQADVTPCVRKVVQLLHNISYGGHEGRYLVIAVSPRGAGGKGEQPPVGVADALINIGAVGPAYRGDRAVPLKIGTFSAIGVLDIAHNHQGSAFQNAGGDLGQQTPGDGAITGYFLRNNRNNYEFEPSDRVAFDTQAGDPDQFTNAIDVGGKRFLASWSHSDVIQVVVLDRRTLRVVDNKNLDVSGNIAITIGTLKELERILTAANDGGDRLVLLDTVHWPTLDRNTQHLVEAPNILDRIARQIERLGGTRTKFFDMFDPSLNGHHHYSYTLVGSSDLGAGRALETLGENPADLPGPRLLNSAPVQGTLVRDSQWNFEVADSEAAGLPADVGTHVVNDAFRAPSDWPEHGNPGRTAAIKWIGDHVGLLGPDPRAQYYTIPYKLGTWQRISGDIKAVPFQTGQGFSQADLDWAQGELVQEITWLEAVHDNLEVMAQPFGHAGLAQWADLQQIATRVRNLVVPADRREPDRTVRALQALVSVGEGLGSIVPAAKAGEITAGAIAHMIYDEYSAFSDAVGIAGEGPEITAANTYQADTDALGVALAKRLDAVQSFLTNQVPNIIADDYKKLEIAGNCFTGNAECPNPISEWQITNSGLNEAAQIVKAAAEINFWGVLLGSKYTAYQLPWSRYTKPGRNFITGSFHDVRCPFEAESGSFGVLARPIHRDIPQGGGSPHNRWEIWAMGFLTGKGTITDGYTMNWPSGDLTARVFSRLDPSGDLEQGGLAVYPEAFFREYFHITDSKDFHYPLTNSPLGRWVDDKVSCTD
jgi:hypothetical protein